MPLKILADPKAARPSAAAEPSSEGAPALEPPPPPSGRPVDLLGLAPDPLHAALQRAASQEVPPFRARQIFAWLHKNLAADYAEMTNVDKGLRRTLAEVAPLLTPRIEDVQVSEDGTRKYQLRTFDDGLIESVFIPSASGPDNHALCISSQIGCAMGCTFCATAALKLRRNLTPGEIVGQVYAVTRELMQSGVAPAPKKGRPPRPISNIVYMGMGEPLHNVDAVIASIGLLTDEAGLKMSPRRLTVSTSGLVPQIARLGAETDVHIAISLNAARDTLRSELMPINRKWSLDRLLAACRDFPVAFRRRLTFEYVLLAGVNDTDADARALSRAIAGLDATVNLIPYNPHPLSPYARPPKDRVEAFRAIVQKSTPRVFVRTTRGDDIDAACGMLGAKKLEQARADAGA